MARKGLNPHKGTKLIPAAPDVTLCVVTHCTDDPYHAQHLDAVIMCLDTMLRGVRGQKYELLIWDNGSTESFRRSLKCYNPEILVESHNIGLHNAQYALAGLARGRVVCVCDDDILFSPDWFEKQLEILETYPKVGAVSGSPQRTAFRWAVSANVDFAKRAGAKIKTGRLIPDEWERDYCVSVERNQLQHRETTAHELDCLLEYKGVKAWAHGHHMQFMGYREIVRKYLFQTPLYLADGRKFNIDLNEARYLNLTTYGRTAVHIGNVVDDNIREIARSMGHEVTNDSKERNISAVQRKGLSTATHTFAESH